MPSRQAPRAPKSRTPSTRRLKATVSYDFHAAASLIGVHKGAIRRWEKQGLFVDRTTRPHRLRGDVLKSYLDARRQSRRQPCKPNEFYCFACRAARSIYENLVDAFPVGTKRLRISGNCVECQKPVSKIQSVYKLPELLKRFVFLQQALERLSVCANPNLNGHLREQS